MTLSPIQRRGDILSQEIAGPTPQVAVDLNGSLASVLARNEGKWLRFVEGVLRSRQDAEDVLQEAIRRVLTRRRALSTEEEVRMYLSRAISNTAMTVYHARKRQRLRQYPLEEQSLTGLTGTNPHSCLEDDETSIEKDYLVGKLKEALSKLPRKQSEALHLTILEPAGNSIRDAGQLHGIPYSTLRHRSLQALKRLRKFLLRELQAKRASNRGPAQRFIPIARR
jgi:RNA polymerase sigma factor (sigma-70 family)